MAGKGARRTEAPASAAASTGDSPSVDELSEQAEWSAE